MRKKRKPGRPPWPLVLHGVLERREEHRGVERLWMAHAIGGRPLYWVSLYRTGDILIDSGCAWARPVVARFLREIPVATVLTTHEHEDHVGNHEIIQADVYAPQRAVDLLREGPPALPPYRWLSWGAHGRAPATRPLPANLTLSGRAFSIMPAPGHSADHVVYVDEQTGAVFTGDAYLGRLKAMREKEDLLLQLETLHRIAELDPEVLYPAHGPILERPRAKLLDTVDHFERLREKALRLQEKGLSPRRIRQRLMGPEPALTYVSLGGFSAENLVRGLLRERPMPAEPTANCA